MPEFFKANWGQMPKLYQGQLQSNSFAIAVKCLNYCGQMPENCKVNCGQMPESF